MFNILNHIRIDIYSITMFSILLMSHLGPTMPSSHLHVNFVMSFWVIRALAILAWITIATRFLLAQITHVLLCTNAIALSLGIHLTCGLVFAWILNACVNLIVIKVLKIDQF